MQFSTLRDQRHGKPSWATCSKGHTIGVCLRERHHWCLLSIESEKKDITEEGVHFTVVSA